MSTHEIARYAYPIIEVMGSAERTAPPPKRSRTSTLKLSLCPPAEPETQAIERWRRPPTVVEHAELPEKLDEQLVLLRSPDSPAATAYRLLRHRLLSLGNPRVIAVTSPGTGEGKSTAAVNLALAIGEELGARVALLEGNLRTPSLAQKLGFFPTVCFAEQMANVDGISRPWIMTKLEGTRVEVAAIDSRAPEHPKLERSLFADAINDLKNEYDYIIVDSPSVFGSADMNTIAEAVDGVVLVARAQKTRKTALRSAIEQLAPARVLGLALLDTTPSGAKWA